MPQENLRGRFNLVAGAGPAGFGEGMECALPAALPPSPYPALGGKSR